MSRPMPEPARRALCQALHGRREQLFYLVEAWLQHLAHEGPMNWTTSTLAQWEELVHWELERREAGYLPVRCLCEEDYVMALVWRLVSNSEEGTHGT